MSERQSSPAESPLVHLIRPPRQAAEGPRPALLMLHGRGADELDLFGLADALDPRLLVISARAPFPLGPGYHWYELVQIGEPDNASFFQSLGLLERFVEDSLQRYQIDPRRLYLLGFSQGAMMAGALTLSHPGWIAGSILLSGYLPLDTGLPVDREHLAGEPFFVAHGTRDTVVPIQLGRRTEEFLSQVDADLTYREYSIAHQISLEEMEDFGAWLSALLDEQESPSQP
ncbi:MAG TPA: alpha/beta hydrolase [Nitrolancea sp.]|nr:alpha/beta hydrolase [Nitrolancea sp.]